MQTHTEKSFRNRIKSNQNQIVFTFFRLNWIQTDIRLMQFDFGLISYDFEMIYLCGALLLIAITCKVCYRYCCSMTR